MTASEAANHPVELLGAYALDALDADEAPQVEAHLDGCAYCSRELAQTQLATAQLAQTVDLRAPSAEQQVRLLARVITAVDPPASRAPVREPALPAIAPPTRSRRWTPLFRFLMPAAAAVIVGLFVVTMVMNLRLSDRTERLQQNNATLTAQVALSAEVGAKLEEKLRSMRLTNFWLADPAVHSVKLSSPNGEAGSGGVLLMSSDGNRAILMVTGMGDEALTSSYEVWLMRQGHHEMAGTVTVDQWGWGAASLTPQESLLDFDKVALVTEQAPGMAKAEDDMVLEAKLPGVLPPQMVVLSPWE